MGVDDSRFEGREKIREFYTWRDRQELTAISSVKTTRHLINNFIVESSDEGRATVLGIISFYGAAGLPAAAPAQAPTLVAGIVAPSGLWAGTGVGLRVATRVPAVWMPSAAA